MTGRQGDINSKEGKRFKESYAARRYIFSMPHRLSPNKPWRKPSTYYRGCPERPGNLMAGSNLKCNFCKEI